MPPPSDSDPGFVIRSRVFSISPLVGRGYFSSIALSAAITSRSCGVKARTLQARAFNVYSTLKAWGPVFVRLNTISPRICRLYLIHIKFLISKLF